MERKIDYIEIVLNHSCAERSAGCTYGNCNDCIKTDFLACGIGDIREFADFLKDYARQVQENGYDGIGENDIDEKLKEFLNNET